MRHVRCVSEAAFIVRLLFLGGVFGNAREPESESIRWRDSFDHRGVRHGFWRGRGQDETHSTGCEHTQFVFVVVCLAVFTALVPLHLETLADVCRLFLRDFVLQDERSDEALEYDRQDDTLLACSAQQLCILSGCKLSVS